ncbi:hypothetical protein AGIG_G8876 [Arapaima gigas]
MVFTRSIRPLRRFRENEVSSPVPINTPSSSPTPTVDCDWCQEVRRCDTHISDSPTSNPPLPHIPRALCTDKVPTLNRSAGSPERTPATTPHSPVACAAVLGPSSLG